MGNKLQTIHYARLISDTRTECIVQRRRDNATANIQLRIMRKLVNHVDKNAYGMLYDVLRSIDATDDDWNELVETLNVE